MTGKKGNCLANHPKNNLRLLSEGLGIGRKSKSSKYNCSVSFYKKYGKLLQ
jgi:hypothetical protein